MPKRDGMAPLVRLVNDFLASCQVSLLESPMSVV